MRRSSGEPSPTAAGSRSAPHGDAFFVAFRSPLAAVRAAAAAQRGLASHDWSPGPPLRVRMGVHTGEGTLGGDDYVGIDVHRAARIADAAHGGQVIVSDATRGLVEHTLPEGASLRDLGTAPPAGPRPTPSASTSWSSRGSQSDFPPPRTLDARPSNLPPQLTSFVGREEEITEVERLLGQTRLLTLTGPGGTGKSRLALQVAADLLPQYRDGVLLRRPRPGDRPRPGPGGGGQRPRGPGVGRAAHPRRGQGPSPRP